MEKVQAGLLEIIIFYDKSFYSSNMSLIHNIPLGQCLERYHTYRGGVAGGGGLLLDFWKNLLTK